MLVGRGSGVAKGEKDEARFTTISGVPVRGLYTAGGFASGFFAGASGRASLYAGNP